ncbi:MAG TPA: amidase family protein, partial [Arenicellales bacterium]|nr:amidase family protein [Arenicellales bacterium]
GILGENKFDGTPQNPTCPGRVPGGSSAGSAVAVAGNYCDFALGTDTGGSVRVPASFCGIYGIRPTQGRLDLSGMVPQAPSSDTAGWFSHSAKTLARVGQILYKADIPERLPKRLLIAHDAFASSDDTVQAALAPKLKRLSELFDEVTEVDMAPDGLVQWSKAQRTIQPTEGWHTFNKWIDQHNPRMSYTVARNLFLASQISQSDLDAAQLVKQQAITRMKTLLPHGTLLCLPTTPFCAPKVGLPVHQTDHLRTQISVLCCHGGLTGVPQVSIPGGTVGEDHAPVGLSIVAGHNYDTDLLAVALALESKHV